MLEVTLSSHYLRSKVRSLKGAERAERLFSLAHSTPSFVGFIMVAQMFKVISCGPATFFTI